MRLQVFNLICRIIGSGVILTVIAVIICWFISQSEIKEYQFKFDDRNCCLWYSSKSVGEELIFIWPESGFPDSVETYPHRLLHSPSQQESPLPLERIHLWGSQRAITRLADSRSISVERIVIHSFGFPFLCSYSAFTKSLSQQWYIHDGFQDQPRMTTNPHAFPSNFIVWGFVLNVFLWGILSNYMYYGVVHIRGRHRFRRNRCIKCGYLLIGLIPEGCPECGWNRPEREGKQEK